MRALVQTVSRASVTVGDEVIGKIDDGLLVLVGVTHDDTPAKAAELARKTYELRILEDEKSASDLGAPLLVVSPWAKSNHVDHTLTDQTSVLKFVEDNWGLGRIGDYSFDSRAGSLAGMLNFRGRPNTKPLILNETTGAVVRH